MLFELYFTFIFSPETGSGSLKNIVIGTISDVKELIELKDEKKGLFELNILLL